MQTDETEQEVAVREPVAEAESVTEVPGDAKGRSRRMLYLAAAVVLVLVVAVGSWLLLRKGGAHEAAPDAVPAAATHARDQAPTVPDPAENQHLLEAARKAHAEILSADTTPGDTGIPAVAPQPEPAPPAGDASAPTSPPSVPPAASMPEKPINIPPRPSPPKVQASVANDPALIRAGGCSPNGESPKEFGAVLGRCLEEFNRAEAEARAAKAARRPR